MVPAMTMVGKHGSHDFIFIGLSQENVAKMLVGEPMVLDTFEGVKKGGMGIPSGPRIFLCVGDPDALAELVKGIADNKPKGEGPEIYKARG